MLFVHPNHLLSVFDLVGASDLALTAQPMMHLVSRVHASTHITLSCPSAFCHIWSAWWFFLGGVPRWVWLGRGPNRPCTTHDASPLRPGSNGCCSRPNRVQVKSSKATDKQFFEVSHNEWMTAWREGPRYHVYRVFGTGQGTVTVVDLQDPCSGIHTRGRWTLLTKFVHSFKH